MIRRPPRSTRTDTLFPYTTLFRSLGRNQALRAQARAPPLFGLAPGGVCRAVSVAGPAVRSYRTLSPLPRRSDGGLLSVALSLGSPPQGVPRHRVSVEPGLSSRSEERRVGNECVSPVRSRGSPYH